MTKTNITKKRFKFRNEFNTSLYLLLCFCTYSGLTSAFLPLATRQFLKGHQTAFNSFNTLESKICRQSTRFQQITILPIKLCDAICANVLVDSYPNTSTNTKATNPPKKKSFWKKKEEKASRILQNKTESGSTDSRKSPNNRIPGNRNQTYAGKKIDNRNYFAASYYISYKSQKQIKDAAILANNQTGLERAISVLNTLLSIPPEKCNAANLVCALTLSAKIIRTDTNDELRSVLYRAIDILSILLDRNKLSARQLCNSVWAIAKHYDRDVELLPMSSRVDSNAIDNVVMLDLRYDNVADPAHRLDETIDKIAVKLATLLKEDCLVAKESELSMASWAYGILRRRRKPAGWKSVPKLSKITGQSNVTSTPQPDVMRFEVLNTENEENSETEHDLKSMDDFDEHRLLDPPSPTEQLFDAIAQALSISTHNIAQSSPTAFDSEPISKQYRIELCRWSEMANLVWAYASHGHAHSSSSQALVYSIASEACRRLDNRVDTVLSRDIAQTIWALGTLQADNYRLAGCLINFTTAVTRYTNVENTDASERPLRSWSCADIVQVASSLAHARLDETALLNALYEESLYRLETKHRPLIDNRYNLHSKTERRNFLPFEISILLWAQARMYLTSSASPIFDAFTKKAIEILFNYIQQSSFDNVGIESQEQANIAWSLTVLENDSKFALPLMEKIFAEAAISCEKEGVIQLEHAHQLWQALRLLQEKHPDIVNSVPIWFRNYLEDKWQLEKSRPKISSARHRALSDTLNLMGVAHYNEHDEDIDVAIILKPQARWLHETDDMESEENMKIAVEFDGPNHFTRQFFPKDGTKPLPPRALGHTVLKYRLLKIQDWTVVRVPYYEFDKIPFWAGMERQRYIQRLLKTHGNIQFSTSDTSVYKPQHPSRNSRYD